MKSMTKILLLICSFFLCFPVTAKAADNFAGGIVTEIPRQMFMTNLPASEFDAGSDPAQLDELTSLLDNFTIIVTCGGENYELPMELSWNRDEIDFQTPGSYELTGTILAPEGCTFAEGVLTQIVMPILINEPLQEEAHTLTMLHNAASLLVGNMLSTGCYDKLEEIKQLWEQLIPSAAAYNEYGDSANLELDHIDDSRILPDTPGEYVADIFLRLPEEYNGIYILDPAISVLHVPVKISDPNNFDLWMSHTTSIFFYLRFLPRASENIRIFRTESSSPMTKAELDQAAWTLYDTLLDSACVYAVPRPLPLDTYVYFYLEDGTARSNILCIVDNGKNGISFSIVGGRDGGDAIESPLPTPDIPNQPDPSIKDPFPGVSDPGSAPITSPLKPDPNHSSDTEPGKDPKPAVTTPPVPDEVPSDTIVDITGEMLLAMLDKGDGTARISNDGITANLSRESLSPYSIKDNSSMETAISFTGDNQFVLGLSIDGVPVQELKDTKIMVPYEMQTKEDSLCLVDQNQTEIPADSYDPDLHVASFTVGQCGTYDIREKWTDTPDSFGSSSAHAAKANTKSLNQTTPKIISVCAVLAVLIFVFFRKKMRR